MRKMKQKAQVWIETVLYTLIGLVLIGVVLSFVYPKINEARDNVLVEQAKNSLNALDEKINEVIQRGVGNSRETEFSMKKGELYINSSGDNIIFVLPELTKPVSEPGIEITEGRIKMISVKGQKTSTVYLRLNYPIDLNYAGKNELKKFSPAATPYKFFIENKGIANGTALINIEEISNR
jgi:type II secretory pathway pseudopilin PulG